MKSEIWNRESGIAIYLPTILFVVRRKRQKEKKKVSKRKKKRTLGHWILYLQTRYLTWPTYIMSFPTQVHTSFHKVSPPSPPISGHLEKTSHQTNKHTPTQPRHHSILPRGCGLGFWFLADCGLDGMGWDGMGMNVAASSSSRRCGRQNFQKKSWKQNSKSQSRGGGLGR